MRLLFPIAIPLTTAVLGLFAWRWRAVQRGLGVAGAAALLITSFELLKSVWQQGPQATWVGNWPPPFGITLIADLLSAIMVALAAVIGFAVALYSLAHVDPAREAFGYYPLLHILLMGVCGAFLTGDLFNLYVWFEVMLMASFVLLALGGERAQLEGAIKYVTLNLMASALFLTAVGLLYGTVGTLNMADVALKIRPLASSGITTSIAFLLLTAFGIKAAIFPLFFWLPASYHTPPVAVSAVFAGLLTKVGVYALLRVFTLIFIEQERTIPTVVLALSALTMLTGVLGAVVQSEFRRILSFNIVSHIGYMILGLGLFTTAGLAGSIFYIIHHIIVITNLFLVSGLVHAVQGSFDLGRLGGLYRTHPGLAVLFLIPALSLSGVPPLSGFFAKLLLVRAGLHAEQWSIVAIALGVSLLTLLSMMKIWAEVFWKPKESDPLTEGSVASRVPPMAERAAMRSRLGLWSSAGLAVLTAMIGLGADFVLAFAEAAAEQLRHPDLYISTMLQRGHP